MRTIGAIVVALLLLAASPAASQDGGGKKKLTRKQRDELLVDKLKLVASAQKNGTDTTKLPADAIPQSDVVAEAPAAPLWAGYGDLSSKGACEEDLARHCRGVDPGEGRLEDCLSGRLEEEAGDAKGRRVSKACRKELAAFKVDRATNVNKDLPLAKACRDDIAQLCAKLDAKGDPSALLDCLRRSKRKLSDKCGKRVQEEEEDEAKDWQVDPGLHRACEKDVEALCEDTDEEVEGAITECLLGHLPQVSTLCRDQLKRVEVERSDDVRLDRHLWRACSRDMHRYCQGVDPDEGRLEGCLQDHREEEGFSDRCREAVEARLERASADYELNYGLREFCGEDIEALCEDEKEAIALAEGFGADAQVIACLETQRDHIRGKRCAEEVHRQLERESEDIRFDHGLATACHKDVKAQCSGLAPGSARVISCLQERRASLSQGCATKLFEHDTRLAEDIDFKYPLRRACATEIDLLCRDVPHGHARIVRCLQDNAEDEEMSEECRAAVLKDQLASAIDFRLNVRLNKACGADVQALCGDMARVCEAAQCDGKVLDCLRERLDEVTSDDCRAEVLHFVKEEAADYRTNVVGKGACDADVKRFCATVAPGKGRMHKCLRDHMHELSARCLATELRLMQLQAADVRLRPQLVAACSEELAVFCKGVAPGKARVYKCLAESMGKPGFGEECRQVMSERIATMQRDYRLDYGIGTSCKADVGKYCAQEQAQGHGQVLTCLVRRYKQLQGGCQDEMSRGVRLALWGFRLGQPLTQVCDSDVQAVCPAAGQKQGSLFTLGSVGRCLSKAVAEARRLTPGCKALVLVAAPRDARSIVADSSASVDTVALKVAEIVKNAGLSSALVSQHKSGLGAITITGWVAFASVCSLVLVVLALAGFGLVKYLQHGRATAGGSGGHRYSRVMKQGDV